MFRQKDLEQRCVAAVATVRGGTPRDSEDQWPDGWIDDAGASIPVEVVSGFPEPNGAQWAHAYSQAARQARKIREETGKVFAIAVRDGRPFVLDDATKPPPVTQPKDPTIGIVSAMRGKGVRYGPNESRAAILVVHQVQWPFPLAPYHLGRVAKAAEEENIPFLEVWIVNEYGDPAQKVPLSRGH